MNTAIAGFVILVVSTLGGLYLVNRPAGSEQQMPKVLQFAIWFWVLAFIQLIVVATGYALLT